MVLGTTVAPEALSAQPARVPHAPLSRGPNGLVRPSGPGRPWGLMGPPDPEVLGFLKGPLLGRLSGKSPGHLSAQELLLPLVLQGGL